MYYIYILTTGYGADSSFIFPADSVNEQLESAQTMRLCACTVLHPITDRDLGPRADPFRMVTKYLDGDTLLITNKCTDKCVRESGMDK